MSVDSITLFPDTNCFLHYPPFSDIDWPHLIGAKAVKLVICLQVIHELDEKKGDSRLGKRAQRAIKDITNLRGKEVRESVTLDIFNCEISNHEFKGSLSIESKDDRIVHLVKLYAEKHQCESIAVITEDLGMQLRCEAGGVASIQMNTDLRLENPTTQIERNYKRTITELNLLKNQQPSLQILVTPHDNTSQHEYPFPILLGDDSSCLDGDKEDARIREKYPQQNETFAELFDHEDFGMMSIKGDRINYNRQLELYYNDRRKWCEDYNERLVLRSIAFMFDIVVANTGQQPAENVEVEIRFPDVFDIFATLNSEEAKPLEIPDEPKPPDNPLTAINKTATKIVATSQAFSQFPYGYTQPSILENITKSFSTSAILDKSQPKAEITIAKLKHNYEVSAGGFIAKFKDHEHIGTFEAHYSITADNIADIESGTLCFSLLDN